MMGLPTGTLYQAMRGVSEGAVEESFGGGVADRCVRVSSVRREATVDWKRHAEYEAGGGAA
jgi:hypothetical protein